MRLSFTFCHIIFAQITSVFLQCNKLKSDDKALKEPLLPRLDNNTRGDGFHLPSSSISVCVCVCACVFLWWLSLETHTQVSMFLCRARFGLLGCVGKTNRLLTLIWNTFNKSLVTFDCLFYTRNNFGV